jgi:hypothetical protein
MAVSMTHTSRAFLPTRLSGKGRARLVLTCGLLLAVAGLVSCGHDDPPRIEKIYPLSSLDSLMLASLEDSRVLALGDGKHGDGAYYRLLTGFLDAWVDTLEGTPATRGLPRKLLLFLEFAEDEQRQFNSFLAAGDSGQGIGTLLESSLKAGGHHRFTRDRLEFFNDLRELTQRLERLNSRTPERVEFEILGTEADLGADPNAMGLEGEGAPRKSSSDWFVTTRDSLLSERVIGFLRQKPDFKAVIYYGTGHLQRTSVDRGEAAKFGGSRFGYWLPHYLDRALGRSQVKVFTTQGIRRPGESACIRQMVRRDDLPDFEVFIDSIQSVP